MTSNLQLTYDLFKSPYKWTSDQLKIYSLQQKICTASDNDWNLYLLAEATSAVLYFLRC